MVALAHKTDGLRESILCKRNEETHTATKADGRYTPASSTSGGPNRPFIPEGPQETATSPPAHVNGG